MVIFMPNTVIKSDDVNTNFDDLLDMVALIQAAGYTTVTTDESTVSAVFADLATPGPAVTVNIGSSGKALIAISCGMYNVADSHFACVAITGATIVAASDTFGIRSDVSSYFMHSFIALKTGLTAGSTTFTLKYRTASGTARFYNRHLSVIPL